ncbi:terminase small subunit [Candidatus Omnitrophota bacterium]
MKLSLKQQRFVDFYEGNGYDAAVSAGYSKKTARAIASENLTKPYILEAIKKRILKVDNSKIMNRKRRQEFWTQVINDEKASLPDRLRASEILGRSEADFTDKVATKGDLTIIYGHRRVNAGKG